MKVYLVLDVFDYGFKIFDTPEKAWHYFVDWLKEWEEDLISFNETEAFNAFEKDDWYQYDGNYDDTFIIAGVTVE